MYAFKAFNNVQSAQKKASKKIAHFRTFYTPRGAPGLGATLKVPIFIKNITTLNKVNKLFTIVYLLKKKVYILAKNIDS